MARPKKTGLDYFPLDTKMDDKVNMLEAEHGLEGFAVYIKLLQEIYQTDAGELDMSIVFRWKTLGKLWGIGSDTLRTIVETALEVGLFDRAAFVARQVLTSNGIRKRLEQVTALRNRDRSRKNDGKPAENEGFPHGKQPENGGNPEENQRISTQKEKEKESHLINDKDGLLIDAGARAESEEVQPVVVEVFQTNTGGISPSPQVAAAPPPPTLEEVKQTFDKGMAPEWLAERFFSYYESCGWVIGEHKEPIRKWKSIAQKMIVDYKQSPHKYKNGQQQPSGTGRNGSRQPAPRNVKETSFIPSGALRRDGPSTGHSDN